MIMRYGTACKANFDVIGGKQKYDGHGFRRDEI
jgi:hypothetical protein